MEIELSMVERRRTPEIPFWTNMSAENIITELMATLRGTGIDRIRADMEQIINENGIREYKRVFTDDPLLETRLDAELSRVNPTSIFNAELQAILEAVK
jgi:hypothetical protein